jgi:hypothetical protein
MMGRPLKFKTAKELEAKIQAYFDECDKNHKPITVSGLAYALNTNRQTLINYANKAEFFDTVMRAKERIEAFVEESLWTPKVAQGVMFNLKNNFGWHERQEITGKDGEPLAPVKDIASKTADELLRLLTAKGTDSARRRK